MNTVALLLVPLATAGMLVTAPVAPQPESKDDLRAFLARLDAEMAAPAAATPVESSAALATSGLTTGRLQAASGLHSAARGLSGAGDWQRLFPRYSKPR